MTQHPGRDHDPAEVTRVVVLVEHDDGRRFGYEVTDIIALRWEWLGVWGRGSIGEVTVSGTFHRVNRYAELDDEAAIDQRPDEDFIVSPSGYVVPKFAVPRGPVEILPPPDNAEGALEP